MVPTDSPNIRGQEGAEEHAIERATLLAASAIGDLMGFWNFKPSMGRVWTVLYLSRKPLSADDLVSCTGLSAGSISMTLSDLQQWGVVRRSWAPRSRKRLYEPETDILAMVTHVIQQRELSIVSESARRLEEALRILDEEGRSSDVDQMLEGRFVATRVRKLMNLARTGRGLLERFVIAGTLDLQGIRGVLGSRRTL